MRLRRVELADDVLHLLRLVLGGDQHRVVRFDHDRVAQAEHGNHAFLGADIAVLRRLHVHVAAEHVPARILFADLPQRRPRADVAPADIHRDDGRGVGLLHHRVVDRIGGTGRERRRVEPHEIEVGRGFLPGCTAGGEHRRRVTTQLLEIASRAEDEHAAVPGEGALLQEPARSRGVGLLDEPRDAKHAVVTGNRLAALDVAVAGRRVIGPDAERREESRSRAGGRRQHRDMECLHIADQMIGRQHEHHRIGIGALQRERSDRHRRSGIASDRLENLHARWCADRAQLLGDEKAVLAVADDRRRFGAGEATQPLDGLLQHGPL